MLSSSRRFIAPLLALAVTTGALTAVAQTKSKSSSRSKSTSSAKKESSKYHRLPTYYRQLKLKDDQVTEIYDIKDDFGPKIDDLEEQIAELKEEQAEKIKDVLTRTQVTALNKLIAGTATTSKSTTAKKSSSKSSKKK